jgi:chemotaxis protein CheX
MMGGMEVSELDFMAKSALGELANMTIGSAVMKLMWSETINLSPPTVVIGEDMTLTVSGNHSLKLKFNLSDEVFSIILSTDRV